MKNFDKYVKSMLFSSLIATWHALFFPIRVNSRMVFQPWLLQQGFLPYVQIGDEHAPLLPHLLAWSSVLFDGDALFTARFLHGFLIWLIIFVSIWIVFERAGRWGAVACGAYYFALSNGLGFWAMWYDLAVTPLFLIAYLVITSKRFSLPTKLFLVGLSTGIGFLVKQHALLLAILVPVFLLTHSTTNKPVWKHYIKPSLLSLVGFLVPVMAYLIYFFSMTNNWYAIWYWLVAFNIAGEYSALGAKTPTIQEIRVILPTFIMILPFVLGTIHLSFIRNEKQKAGERWWLLLIMMLTAVMLYPRYSTMHWATMLPFLAIVSGIACGELVSDAAASFHQFRYRQWGVYLAIVGLLWIGPGTLNYIHVYRERENRILIEYDGLPELAELITNTTTLDSILLFPDDEGVGNLYYLLEKTPPGFWMMNYPWFRNRYEIDQWMTAVTKEPPDQIIYFASRGPDLYPEMNQFVTSRYHTVHELEWNGQLVEIKERSQR
ncbi:MAG: hypothetical protein CL608_19075 [Anaerolineaceae bacterium]|nr:hypothetical protein [Anaerolineaceae bacterium]